MKVVLLDTSYPINSRNKKILQSIEKVFPLAEIHQVVWDRMGNSKTDVNPFVHVYNKPSPLGELWTKGKNLLGYRHFAKQIIREINPDVIIASHWDTLVIVPRLDRKRQKLIYENLDIPTGRLRFVFVLLERMALRRTDLIIHASRFYRSLYPKRIKQIILENKPFFEVTDRSVYSIHRPLRIAYIGNIRYKEILFNLIDAVKGDFRLHLTFHGGGVEYEEVKTYSLGISNIEMTGTYDYKDIDKVYADVDVIWAVYPNKDFNVKYAISNKFFESIYLGIPALFAKGTMLGDYVQENNIGQVVDPYDVADIKRVSSQMIDGRVNLSQIADNLTAMCARQTSWDDDFAQVEAFLKQ